VGAAQFAGVSVQSLIRLLRYDELGNQGAAMNATAMIDLMNRTPFEPIEIHMSDGSNIRVEHPYAIATNPKSHSCIVYQHERMRIIAYRNITEVITKVPAD
jgi:hypothetical protein